MKLSREEAEQVINTSNVISTSVKQGKKEIQIYMKLANTQTCIVTYDRSTHEKSYKLDN